MPLQKFVFSIASFHTPDSLLRLMENIVEKGLASRILRKPFPSTTPLPGFRWVALR